MFLTRSGVMMMATTLNFLLLCDRDRLLLIHHDLPVHVGPLKLGEASAQLTIVLVRKGVFYS